MLSVGAATGCWCCHWGRAVPAAPTPAAPTLHGVVTRSGMALAPSLVTINLSLRCLKSVAAIGWGPIYRIGLIRIYCFAVFLIEALSYNGLHTMQKVLALAPILYPAAFRCLLGPWQIMVRSVATDSNMPHPCSEFVASIA